MKLLAKTKPKKINSTFSFASAFKTNYFVALKFLQNTMILSSIKVLDNEQDGDNYSHL